MGVTNALESRQSKGVDMPVDFEQLLMELLRIMTALNEWLPEAPRQRPWWGDLVPLVTASIGGAAFAVGATWFVQGRLLAEQDRRERQRIEDERHAQYREEARRTVVRRLLRWLDSGASRERLLLEIERVLSENPLSVFLPELSDPFGRWQRGGDERDAAWDRWVAAVANTTAEGGARTGLFELALLVLNDEPSRSLHIGEAWRSRRDRVIRIVQTSPGEELKINELLDGREEIARAWTRLLDADRAEREARGVFEDALRAVSRRTHDLV